MSLADCAQALKTQFPALFAGAPKPLKLRIQADIQQRAPGVYTKQVLSAFFRRYTGSTSYLIALTRAAHRYDLDGQPAGELSEEHKQLAAEELARRRERHEQRRAAEDAERQQQRAAQEAERRQRAELLRDFERTTLNEANFCTLKGLTPEALHATLEQARQEARERPPQQRPPRFDERGPARGAGQREGRPAEGRREGHRAGQRTEGFGKGRGGPGPRDDRARPPREQRRHDDRPRRPVEAAAPQQPRGTGPAPAPAPAPSTAPSPAPQPDAPSPSPAAGDLGKS
jgi:sRNA-binding protein